MLHACSSFQFEASAIGLIGVQEFSMYCNMTYGILLFKDFCVILPWRQGGIITTNGTDVFF